MLELNAEFIKQHCLHYATPEQPIVSPSGRQQSWLIDLRPLFLRKEALEQLARAFWEQFADHPPFQLAGMETASIPLLTALLLSAPDPHSKLGATIIRKERKASGLGKIIEGSASDAPVILVDDTFNSSKSAEKARATLAISGYRVTEIFAIINYGSEPGRKWLAEQDVKLTSLFTLADFGLAKPAPPAEAEDIVQPLRYQLQWDKLVPGAKSFHVVPKSAPLLIGDRIYRGCDTGLMHCFDAMTGDIIWEYRCPAVATMKGIWSSPAYHKGRIYFGAYNGTVYCLDAITGEEIWTQPCCEWIGASPLIVPNHNLVYFGLEYERSWAQGALVALDLDTGEMVWEQPLQKMQHGSAAYWRSGDMVIWGTADYEMLGLRPETGEKVWSFRTRRSVKYAPFIDEERGWAAFASFDKSIYLLDLKTGAKLGEWETGEICYTTPLIVGDRLFCGSGDRNMYVIDLVSMEIIKKIYCRARVYSSPKLVGGNVIFGTNGGEIIEIDPANLKVRGKFQLADAVSNAVAVSPDETILYVSTAMNHLFAVGRQ